MSYSSDQYDFDPIIEVSQLRNKSIYYLSVSKSRMGVDDRSHDRQKWSRLNDIASGRPAGEFYDDDDISQQEFQHLCESIWSDVEEMINDLADGTVHTRRQAQVRALKRKIKLPSDLTNNAIGVLIGYIEKKDSPIDESAVRQSYEQAKQNAIRAERTTYVETAPKPLRGRLNHEQIIWIDRELHRMLEERRQDGEQSLFDVIDRLVIETKEVKSLRKTLESIITEENVSTINVPQSSVSPGEEYEASKTNPRLLRIDVSSTWGPGRENPLSEYVVPGTVYEYDGYYLKLDLIPSHTPSGPLNALQLYADEDIRGMDPVSLADGLENLGKKLQQNTKETEE